MATINKPSGMSTIWASTGVTTVPAASKIATGWVVELPPYQTANFIENKQDTFNAHVNQHGLPVWDNATEYQGNVSYTKGSNGLIYKCLQTHTNADPINPLNSSFWQVAFEAYGSVAAVQAQVTALSADYATLANISNTVAARSNLSVWSRAEADARYAMLAGSAGQTFSVATATLPHHAVRLDQVSGLITQATESAAGVAEIATNAEVSTGTDNTRFVTPLKLATLYLSKAGNLAGLGNVATARTNLGLGSAATANVASFLQAANNLSDLANVTTARANLGLTSTAIQPESYFLRTANNLSDVVAPTARTNLGLGNSATRNVGTTAGTVMDGADSRVVNAVPNSRSVSVTGGLFGGGALTGNIAIALGTPSTISASSSNIVSGTTHTHAFDINSYFGDRNFSGNGYQVFPGGLIVQWMNVVESSNVNDVRSWPRPFNAVLGVSITPYGTSGSLNGGGIAKVVSNSGLVFTAGDSYGNGQPAYVIAIGY